MAFYLYNGAFLLDGGAFAIAEACCCGGTCYLLRECDDVTDICDQGSGVCAIPMQNTIKIVFSGLGGDFATHNGTEFTITKSADFCSWTYSATGIDITLGWAGSPFNGWDVQLATDGGCYIDLKLTDATGCNPVGTYTYYTCDDSTCGDTGSCEASTGATAVISYDVASGNDIIVNDDLSTYSYGDVIAYNNKCYVFIGVIACSSPTTMGTWADMDSCSACEVICNTCDPALALQYDVEVFVDSGEPFDSWTGNYTLTYDGSCDWIVNLSGTLNGFISMTIDATGNLELLIWDDDAEDGWFFGVGDTGGACVDPTVVGTYYGDFDDYGVVS